MNNKKAKILVLVEGAKTEVVLFNHLLNVYNIDSKHEIVSYHTNIYVLYDRMFKDDDPDTLDLLQVLKEHEKDEKNRKILEERYSDILLIFDLDPQDRLYSTEKIQRMLEYFDESSENGKLYINYPMSESFYHMKSIPDPDYNSYTVSMQELKEKTYKSRVQKESWHHDYRKFAQTREECTTVIVQNIKKALMMTGNPVFDDAFPPPSSQIIKAQSRKLHQENCVYVLCTCVFYISDYNPILLRKTYK